MEDAADTKETILKRSLDEVRESHGDAEPCVICLEPISEPATTNPCHHHNFDYLCLLNWLEQQRTCPLCKTNVVSVEYAGEDGSSRTYVLPDKLKLSSSGSANRNATHGRNANYRDGGRWRPPPRPRRSTAPVNQILMKRRDVYRNQMYSLHVGSNRMSAYQDLTPERIANTPALLSRARTWTRRELKVFTFLNETSSESSSSQEPTLRNVSNAFFLLEYVIAIVKTVDIKSSLGQAEDMLADFLGRQNAKLFLHELGSFLRSPYETPEAWDRHVQYGDLKQPEHRDGSRTMDRKRHYADTGDARVTSGAGQQPKRRSLGRHAKQGG